VSLTASVDRNRIAFGESVTFSLNLSGTQDDPKGNIPKVDGLTFEGPLGDQRINSNGQLSRIISFRVTPTRLGEFTIPGIELEISGKKYVTDQVRIVVQKDAPQESLKDKLFGKVVFDAKDVYVGQIMPIQIRVFVRDGVPLKDLGLPQCETDGLNYYFRKDRKIAETIIDGVRFKVILTEGAASFSRPERVNLGSCVLRSILEYQRKPRSLIEEMMGGGVENREVSVPVEGAPVEVLPLPEGGRPADFAGAVGQWNLEITAKPTEVAVGDPITFTIKVSGNGNIDTVPAPKLGSLDGFKTYDPTTKTTKDDLNTTGERVIQQVLIPRSTDVKELPEVRLAYFDPVAKAYKVAMQPPIKLAVKAGSGGQTTIVSGGNRLRPEEKLGQDIVYLKGDLGPVAAAVPFYATATFWTLNILPVFALLGGVGWKQRADRLRGDVAYARRSRSARNARKLLASAQSYADVQRALQNYLGDRLNIPTGGITASIVDEHLVPRGVNGELAAETKACFEACDTARFAGGEAGDGVTTTRGRVERLIDELEKKQL
jgi:hypothetical protein